MTARPGASFLPYTTGKNVFQLQTGVFVDWFKDNELDRGNGFGSFSTLRYGPTERFEVRASFGFRGDRITNQSSESSYGGINVLSAGLKWNVIDGKGSGPALAFQQEFLFNVGTSEEYRITHIAPSTLLLFNMPLTSWLSLTTNLGVIWNGESAKARGYYTFNLAFPLFGKLGGFVELFSFTNDDFFGTSFDTGLAYLINNNFQLDLSYGLVGLADGNDAHFVDGGISWRFGNHKE